jgi:predicted ATPase/DNA-binding CsgD family transcriptional regulator
MVPGDVLRRAGNRCGDRGELIGVSAVVPAAASSFVGRVGELAALEGLVGRERLVTLVGPGGCGKTRLAMEFAGRGRVRGFVELAALGPRSDLASAVLIACGMREEPGRSSVELLRDRLGREGGLLVLDNCEHLQAQVSALVDDLLRSCASLRVLVTSRASVGLAAERVLPLTGLEPAGDGAALLLDRARGVQPELPDGPGTNRIAAEICRMVDGLPLAIELAAAHARTLPLVGIRDGMADRMAFLATRRRGGLRRHDSLVASLDWSAELVGARARAALAALSIVDGRFPLEVAVAVTGGDRDVVETLVDHSLVQFDVAEGRYVLLETVREYAAVLLARSHQADLVHGRLLDWTAAFAHDLRGGLERADADALHRVAHADAAVLTALNRALTTGRGVEMAAGIAVDLAFGWSLRGRCGEGVALVQRLTAALNPPPPALQWAHGFLAIYSGDMEAGFGLATAAVEHAGDDGRTAARARILIGMVQAFADPAGAEPFLAEAVTLADEAGDDWGQVEASQVLAYADLFRGRLNEAVACADVVRPALERLGHGQLRAWDAAIRADVAATTGRYAEAEDWGQRGFELAIGVGEPVSAFGAMTPLVRALVATGRTAEASGVLDVGLAFLDTHPGLGTETAAMFVQAVVASAGEPHVAEAAAAAAMAAAADMPFWTMGSALLLAIARLRVGNVEGAREAADTAAGVAARFGNAGAEAAAALIAAAADRAGGHEASRVYEALAQAHELGIRPLVVDGLALAGALARDAGRLSVAARLHGASERLRAELGAAVSPLGGLVAHDAAFLDAHAEAVTEGARLQQVGAVGYTLRNRGRRGRPKTGWDSLTPAERQVAALAARGRSNLEIAHRLLISTATVRTHLRSVYAKLGLTGRVELAAAATKQDL